MESWEAFLAAHLSYIGTAGDILDENILLDSQVIRRIPTSDVHLGVHYGELQGIY